MPHDSLENRELNLRTETRKFLITPKNKRKKKKQRIIRRLDHTNPETKDTNLDHTNPMRKENERFNERTEIEIDISDS